jgi:hypothetical protein
MCIVGAYFGIKIVRHKYSEYVNVDKAYSYLNYLLFSQLKLTSHVTHLQAQQQHYTSETLSTTVTELL